MTAGAPEWREHRLNFELFFNYNIFFSIFQSSTIQNRLPENMHQSRDSQFDENNIKRGEIFTRSSQK